MSIEHQQEEPRTWPGARGGVQARLEAGQQLWRPCGQRIAAGGGRAALQERKRCIGVRAHALGALRQQLCAACGPLAVLLRRRMQAGLAAGAQGDSVTLV